MNTLWTFGDSWTEGCQWDPNEGEQVFYKETFSYIVAKKLNYNLVNLGIGGFGNNAIYRKVNTYLPNFNKNDVIIITWTTPYRNERTTSITELPKYIIKLEEKLKGYKVIMTQAFNPLFGYDYIVDKINPKTFIEWGKPNNTMLDLITNNWLKDNQNNVFLNKSIGIPSQFIERFAKDKKHPGELGHKLIADKILEYL